MTGFDRVGFSRAITAVIRARDLTDKAAAFEIGVGPATLNRVIRLGKTPDIHNLALMVDWAGLPLEAFVTRTRPLVTEDAARVRAVLEAAEAIRTLFT